MNQARSAVLVVAAGLGLAACQSVPFTGRRHVMLVSEGQEKKLGEDAYKDTLAKAKVSTDTEKVALIRKVGHRIAKAANRPDFQWEFNLLEDDKMINAWCLPGGKVAFYTGILPVTKTEEGVAVVMGHEVAHALARHGGERMSQGMIAQFGGQALSILLSGKGSPATREIANQAYGIGVGVGVMLPFSRHQESEADKIGLILMAKAGYDPSQAIDFWGRMAQAAGEKGNQPLAKFLGTHPPSKERQDKIRGWLPEAMSHYKAAPEAPPR
ncbi:MAG: M48 family metallopeptidase [Elusimicrobia bacterium]|nr:M48 family metallopeptidase [Elusimicrobiota bacterium]